MIVHPPKASNRKDILDAYESGVNSVTRKSEFISKLIQKN
jgi:hypothetical protein